MLNALNRFFAGPTYERDLLKDGSAQVIEWWEARRLHYNKVLAIVGATTCALLISCGLIAEPLVGEAIGIPNPPILMPIFVVVFAVAANVCYTGGWIMELVFARLNPGKNSPEFGARLFRFGMKLSIGLTLFPAVLCWAILLLGLALGGRNRAS